MAFVDYYKVLGIEKGASPDDIKKAYRKLARKYHPDMNPNDEAAKQRFQEINEANEVLTDPEKRKKYDQYGENWKHGEAYEQASRQQGNQQRGNPGENPFEGYDFGYTGDYESGEFSDFFGQMFGNRRGGGRQTKFRGNDYTSVLTLTLEQAYRTHQQTFTVNGKNIRITIPAGVEHGQKIKLKGQGGEGINGGPNGDLFIQFEIQPDPAIQRRGNDLYRTLEVDLYTMVLGGEMIVDTFSGKVKVKVKPYTQNGTKVRLKGRGFPIYKQEEQFGDLLINMEAKLPTDLSDQEKELFQQLAALKK